MTTNNMRNEEVSKACTSILLRSCDEEFRLKCYRLLMVSDTSTAYDVLKEKVKDLLVGKVNNNRLQLPDMSEMASKKCNVIPETTEIQALSSSEDSVQNCEELDFFNLDVWSQK